MHSDLIMVVDDDEDLRHPYVQALKLKGFKVQAYSNTSEALEEIRDDPRKYRLGNKRCYDETDEWSHFC